MLGLDGVVNLYNLVPSVDSCNFPVQYCCPFLDIGQSNSLLVPTSTDRSRILHTYFFFLVIVNYLRSFIFGGAIFGAQGSSSLRSGGSGGHCKLEFNDWAFTSTNDDA